jgi:pimeloyl-ACP methyl ester carboxylesterase
MGSNSGEVGLMPYVLSRDAKIYYEVRGEGPPLVLVEGLGYAMWMWIMQVEDLSRDFKLIMFDNRGVGKSDKPPYPYTMDLFADDLKAVLDVNNVEKAHILGVSMGGMIAQHFALKYPSRVKSLILVATHHGGRDVVPPSKEVIQVMFGPPPPGIKDERELYRWKMSYALSKKWYNENQDIVNRLVELRLAEPQPPEAYLNQASAAFTFDASTKVSEITAPTLIIHGSEDLVVPVENAYKLHEKIASSSLIIFKGAGHLVHVERATLFNNAVTIFVKLVERGRYRPLRRPLIVEYSIAELEKLLSGSAEDVSIQ